MALLPPTYLDAVIAIGAGDDPKKREWIGTGFLYGEFAGKNEQGQSEHRIFLLTNKHVLQGQDRVWLKFNALSGSESRDFGVSLRPSDGADAYVMHPSDDVDLSTISLSGPALVSEKIKFNYFQSDVHTYTVGQLKDEGITEGDGVYVLGYPMGLVDSRWQAAICRLGCIARIQDVLHADSGEFLVDAAVFPGNSGGPVILQPQLTAVTGTKNVRKAALIGVVQSYLPYKDVCISLQTRRPRIVFEENSRLASVIPVDRIQELMRLAVSRLKEHTATADQTETKEEKTDES